MFDLLPINVADPKVFIGLLIGGAVPFLFSALAIRAVGRTAGVVVQEVRKQFADGKIMKGEKQPEYGPVIDICTEASLRELATPALLAVLTPVIVGFGINFFALGAFLAAVILVGQLMANYLSNAGGAWDNAKKYIEDGHHGGKGSDPYRAAVIADTVGDPFKDTAGPALNPLIKVMNLVSLLILPAIISLEDNDGARYSIAAGALAVLIGAVIFSSRKAGSIMNPTRRTDARFLIMLALFDIENWLDQRRARTCSTDRLRRVRPADRLLPSRRLAAVRRRVPVVGCRRQRAAAAADHGRRDLRRGGARRPGRVPVRPQGRPEPVRTAEEPAVQPDQRGEGSRVLRAARAGRDRAGTVRSHRAHVHADRRRRCPHELPHVRDLQPDRRIPVGRRSSRRSATSSARSTS